MILPIACPAAWVMVQQGTDEPAATAQGLSATQLFTLADEAKSDGRNEDALALYAALAKDPDPEVRAEARFRRGMLLAELKRYTEAATAFRALLDDKPNAARVRLELARVLASMGDEVGARRAVRQARATGLPEDVAATVDQFARALRSTRPFGGSMQVALAPDSNINRATQARTLDTVIAPLTLSRDARARSGVGARVSGQGYARLPITETLSIVPRAAALGNFYRQRDFNDVSASGLVGVEWRHGRDRWSPAVGFTQRWYAGDAYARTKSTTLDWLHPLGREAQLIVHGGAAATDYLRNDLQDGGLFDAAVGYERAVNARSGFGATLAGYRQTASDPGYATVSGGITVSAWQDVGRTTFLVNAGLNRLEGDARLFLFPERRREWLVNSSVAATLRQLSVHGFVPTVRLLLEHNKSTVGLYQYRRIAGDIGLSRAF